MASSPPSSTVKGDRKPDDGDKKEKKFERVSPPARVGRKQRKQKGLEAAAKLKRSLHK
ncbi:unnamed protein product [Arabidopsis lyrata]|uniref:Predicted protein n=1 Tax=Arabidopsis lyrata subsp. lyrata TaxID=81972 RepID=D7LP29_ARALL|nr:predicted protein [Arabidopsis lyrata subsp. lyrata]EFH53465.1 hypothetical protein ARALYDRAFT_905285 [Arabidopsis lyrata subsp. lyrata]CAH8262283.1 unnamed protein product [Arabidopsis lyrata]CAH8276929.1 unnamed protein product [Arabidopsis lyrata]